MLVPGLIAQEGIEKRVVRELPIIGQILVKVGDAVLSDQVVATAELPGDLIVLKLAEKMGLDPQQIKQSILVKVKDKIKHGQLICSHSGLFGLFKSKFNSSISGEVDFFSEQTGHLGLRTDSKRLDLVAHVAGRVENIVPNKSVTIKTTCTLVQGIFGVSGERRGQLKVLATLDQIELLDKSQLENKVLVVPVALSSNFLKRAQESGVVGVIASSIDDQTLREFVGYDIGVAMTGSENLALTLIVTEGFGKLSMSDRVYQIFKKYDNSPVSIDGTTKVRAGAERPEIVIFPQDQGTILTRSAELPSLSIGSKVRIIRHPFFGLEGSVTALPHALTEVESGVLTRVMQVDLGESKVIVPRANVELIVS